VDRAERLAIITQWPRVQWRWRSRKQPYRWWWLYPVPAAALWFIAAAIFDAWVLGLAAGTGTLIIGLVMARWRYQQWLSGWR
jgi:hypothetical protein